MIHIRRFILYYYRARAVFKHSIKSRNKKWEDGNSREAPSRDRENKKIDASASCTKTGRRVWHLASWAGAIGTESDDQ